MITEQQFIRIITPKCISVSPMLNYSMERSQIRTMEIIDLLDTILMYKLTYIL